MAVGLFYGANYVLAAGLAAAVHPFGLGAELTKCITSATRRFFTRPSFFDFVVSSSGAIRSLYVTDQKSLSQLPPSRESVVTGVERNVSHRHSTSTVSSQEIVRAVGFSHRKKMTPPPWRTQGIVEVSKKSHPRQAARRLVTDRTRNPDIAVR